MVPSSLVNRAAAGEIEAFERLLAPVIDSAYFAALGMLEDPGAAEAAVVAACRRAFRQLNKRDADDAAALRLWFVSIVRGECHRRRRRVRPAVLASDADPGSTQQLRQAIGKLSFQERSLIVFHHYLGLSIDEVSHLERLTPEAARVRLAQAAERLAPLVGGATPLDQEDLVFARRMQRLMNSLGGPSRKLRPRIDRSLRRHSLINRNHLLGALAAVLVGALVVVTLPLLPAFARDAQKALDTFPILPGGGSVSQAGATRSVAATEHPRPQGQTAGSAAGGSTGTGSGAGTGSSGGTRATDNPSSGQGSPQGAPPALVIADVASPAAEVGVAYGPLNIAVSGGSPPYQWSAGGLPAGLSLSSGHISGTPSASGPASVTVTVTDARGQVQTKAFGISVAGPVGIGATPAQGELGAPYSGNYAALAGVGPFTWTCTACPSGLSVMAGGAITGTPTASPASVSVKVTDSLGASATRTDNIAIAQTLVVAPASLPAATHGQAYLFGFAGLVSQGVAPYGYSASGMPPGMALDPAGGVLSGTPPSAGVFNITLTVTDSCPAGRVTRTQLYTLTVN